MEKLDPKGLNKEVRNWSRTSRNMMEKRVRRLTNKNKHAYLKIRRIKGIKKGKSSISRNIIHLADSIKQKTRSRFGVVERIIFPFAKHGIFIDIGVSRGHKKTNPRKKIDWYRFVFEERMDMLADVVAEKYADAAVKSSALGKK